jgi:ribonuclease E
MAEFNRPGGSSTEQQRRGGAQHGGQGGGQGGNAGGGEGGGQSGQ